MLREFERRFEIRATRNSDKFLGFFTQNDGGQSKLHNAPMEEWILTGFKRTDCEELESPLPVALAFFRDDSKLLVDET